MHDSKSVTEEGRLAMWGCTCMCVCECNWMLDFKLKTQSTVNTNWSLARDRRGIKLFQTIDFQAASDYKHMCFFANFEICWYITKFNSFESLKFEVISHSVVPKVRSHYCECQNLFDL